MGRPKKMTGVERLAEAPHVPQTGVEQVKAASITPKHVISIVERRLKSGSIFTAASRPIPLKEPDRWTIRIINSQISENHLYELQADKGWIFATPDDLAVKAGDVGLREQDGRLVRGQHGAEVLMKMERADYAAIQHAKDDANRAQTFGQQAVKRTIIAAAEQEPGGGLGAEFLERHLEHVTVKDSRERVNLED